MKRLWRSGDLLATVAVCIAWGARPGQGRALNIDHAVYLSTVHFMRRGVGYYEAMDRALRAFIGPPSTARAFRPPSAFLLWRLLPNDRAIWVLLVVLVGIVSVAVARMVRVRWVAPLLAIYFLHDAWNKFTLVELWACVLVAAAVVVWSSGHRRTSVVLGVGAILVRETTVLFLVGGLLAAHRNGERRSPWLAGLGIGAAAFALQLVWAAPHLVRHGTEEPLLGTGRPPLSVLRFMGEGLPAAAILGPIVWFVAVLTLLNVLPRTDERRWVPPAGFDELLLPYLALPILGVLVSRDVWGVLVVPFTVALSASTIDQQLRWALRARTQARA